MFERDIGGVWMRVLIAYSSKTGNTKMIAEEIFTVFHGEADLYRIEDAPNPDPYDAVIVGFWVDKGSINLEAANYLKEIRHKKVAVFATVGSNPTCEHSKDSFASGIKLVDASNEILGSYLCQGKVPYALIEQLLKRYPMSQEQGQVSIDWQAIYEEGKTHPNEEDVAKAREVFSAIREKLHHLFEQNF